MLKPEIDLGPYTEPGFRNPITAFVEPRGLEKDTATSIAVFRIRKGAIRANASQAMELAGKGFPQPDLRSELWVAHAQCGHLTAVGVLDIPFGVQYLDRSMKPQLVVSLP